MNGSPRDPRRDADPADRSIFALDDGDWDELQAALDRPAVRKPELAKLLTQPSILQH